jgi:hypothetical protein|tara:strand:+ start:1558 stop:1917 length:360 start_codon:yes stop_codon:yes gene_type:complete
MGFKRLFRFMSVAFIGGLGLFNSTKLEIRQITDTNAELIFQNGQIISSAIVCLSLAGFLSELVLMRKGSRSESETIDLITYDDSLSAQEFYVKYSGDEVKSDIFVLNKIPLLLEDSEEE